MIPDIALAGLLQLDERWEVAAAEFETEPMERFLSVVRETPGLWPSLRCSEPTCGRECVPCHDNAKPRTWANWGPRPGAGFPG